MRKGHRANVALQETENYLGILEPSVAQPPLPLQLFLPLQPLSLLLQPPVPLQSFFPLQECLAGASRLTPLNDSLPAFRMGAVPDELSTDACIAVAPLSRPDTAAATIMVFKDCFICHSSIGFRGPDQAQHWENWGAPERGTSQCGLDYII